MLVELTIRLHRSHLVPHVQYGHLQVDRLSKSLGVNIEQLQAWQGAAQNAGVQADEIGEIFADLNDWMIDAAVNGSGINNG